MVLIMKNKPRCIMPHFPGSNSLQAMGEFYQLVYAEEREQYHTLHLHGTFYSKRVTVSCHTLHILAIGPSRKRRIKEEENAAVTVLCDERLTVVSPDFLSHGWDEGCIGDAATILEASRHLHRHFIPGILGFIMIVCPCCYKRLLNIAEDFLHNQVACSHHPMGRRKSKKCIQKQWRGKHGAI